MAVSGMNHFTVLTDDVPGTVDFYTRMVGLTDGWRPDLGFPGAWLYAGDAAVLHVIGGRQRDELRPGVIDHMAFSARGLAQLLEHLKAHDVEHICRQQKGSGIWQIFVFDPNGARVELDFAPDESPARA
jgi:catechol 2,3-dioxygenase-like lactoylglutathione lyase family enzyme